MRQRRPDAVRSAPWPVSRRRRLHMARKLRRRSGKQVRRRLSTQPERLALLVQLERHRQRGRQMTSAATTFHIGDAVVYAMHGTGSIKNILTRTTEGRPQCFYQIVLEK